MITDECVERTRGWEFEDHAEEPGAKGKPEVLLALAGIHVTAVVFYALVLRRNLITAMFTGRKPLGKPDSDTDSVYSVSDTESAPALRFTHPAIALAIAAGAAGGVWLLVR